MARSEARRQKQLAKKNAKRAARHGAIRQQKSQSTAQRIVAARNAIRHCVLQRDDLIEEGIGSAAVTVNLPNGEVGVVVFLIDRYCLGVKDAFGNVMPSPNYTDWFEGFCDKTGAVSTSPHTVRKLLDDSVEFARSCGLSPHPGYRKWKAILDGADPLQARETFEMGHEGKPLFVAGPYDNETRCRAIVAQLEEHCGAGNYDYVVGVSPNSEILAAFDEADDDDPEDSRITYYDDPHDDLD